MSSAPDRSISSIAPQSLREIETKFDVASDFEVPDLGRFSGADGRIEVDTVQLASTYYDSDDLRLLRFHLTVRRRRAVGNTGDVGWQLKVPGAGFRTEFHWPADESDQPPAELLALLTPFLDGRELAAAIRLEVERARHRIHNARGELIAEVAHDHVQAIAIGSPVRAHRWDEVEVELGPAGGQAKLARIGRVLVKAGAGPSTSRSKLARAVAGVGNESIGGPRASAGAVLSAYVAAQVDAIVAGHFAIHGDEDDSVHQTRVASRRIRSTLRVFRDWYATDQANEFDREVKWYAGVLGAVRDLEVLRVRLAKVLARLPDDQIVGPVAQRVDTRLTEQLSAARADLMEALDADRYGQLLARMIEWRDNPPFTAAAGRPAATLAKAVRQADKMLQRRLDRATDADGTDTEMHRARKAGKRARYAGEAVSGDATSGRAKKLQDLLGEFQDSVVAADVIRHLAVLAHGAGEDTFTYGVLYCDQRSRAAHARSQVASR